ncbi:MAG: ACT domain-containing protein [Planctomycetia bacterium]|nr:ACT domain-containing protein [Planctomycetia bacterium]
MSKIESRYYLRFDVIDRPGVLAGVAKILGDNDVSIASVIQHESADAQYVPLIIMTHLAPEAKLQKARQEVAQLETVGPETVCVRVLDFE